MTIPEEIGLVNRHLLSWHIILCTMPNLTTAMGFLPLRREPSERSEMVSQLLFGEWAESTGTAGNWIQLRTLFDGYSGWADKNALIAGDRSESAEALVTVPYTRVRAGKTGRIHYLPAGSVISDYSGDSFSLAGEDYIIEREEDLSIPGPQHPFAQTGEQLCSIPYLWGGRSGFGFDCSGLTQFICRLRGYAIPRDAGMQSLVGTTINFVHEALPGDLLFFDNEEGQIVHTGLVINEGMILHASGAVRIDRFDHQGIFHGERKAYSHKLRVIKRI